MITGTLMFEVIVNVDEASEEALQKKQKEIEQKLKMIEDVESVEYTDCDLEDDEDKDPE